MEPATPAPEMMKVIGEKYADDIRRGFDLAGYPNLYPPFIDRVRQSAYTKTELAVGSRMLWMIFRSQGQIRVVHDLEWAGREPSPGLFLLHPGRGQELGYRHARYPAGTYRSCGSRRPRFAAEEPRPPDPAGPGKAGGPASNLQSQDLSRHGRPDKRGRPVLFLSIWEDEIPGLKIMGAEREYEKTMSSDGDIVYLNQGRRAASSPARSSGS